MPSSSKPRAQGGGRKSNSEPRQQVFRDFGGCNFELSPRDFSLGRDYPEQSDLQMNYVVVQNNAGIVSNKTIETRNNISRLLSAPSDGRKFTGVNILINGTMYCAMSDGSIIYFTLGAPVYGQLEIVNHADEPVEHHWQSFAYVDDKLVGTTLEDMLWTGEIGSGTIENARKVPDPEPLDIYNLSGFGDLVISETQTEECSFRIAVAIAYVNKFGSTACSDQFAFYASVPVSEWHSGCYLDIAGLAPTGYDIQAVEIYYTVDNSSSLLLAGRTDDIAGTGLWSFDWLGYLDTTEMWPIANLIAPDENLTEGVKASHVKCIDSRLYFWGSHENPQRLWIGGNSGNLFNTSAGVGGGFVDVEPGSGLEIRVVDKYKTQSGNSIITILCDCKNSYREQRFNLVENSISLSNEQSMKSWQTEQVAGAVGCKSFHGAVVCQDGLYSVSRYGLALTTMTMEYNSQIRTTYVSDPVKPIFVDKHGYHLKNAMILECDGVIYLAFGTGDETIDSFIFCYDIDLKSWWSISLDIDEDIIGMLHIDYEGYREGIGIVTKNKIYLLPLTIDDPIESDPSFTFLIQTGELSTTQPQQNWQYLSQLEFRFDYFVGSAVVELTGIDQFGRKVTTKKQISHDSAVYNLAEYMRIDLRLQSYQIRITGHARFRLTHFIAKVYTMSAKQGLVWGFNDSQSFRSDGDIHPTFKDYNDIRQAIIV